MACRSTCSWFFYRLMVWDMVRYLLCTPFMSLVNGKSLFSNEVTHPQNTGAHSTLRLTSPSAELLSLLAISTSYVECFRWTILPRGVSLLRT